MKALAYGSSIGSYWSVDDMDIAETLFVANIMLRNLAWIIGEENLRLSVIHMEAKNT